MTTRNLSLTSIVQRNTEPISVDVEESVVMMSVEQEKYYSVDGVGARIWQLVESKRSVSEVCDILASEYAVDAEQCQAEVLDFLTQLTEQGLLEIVDESLDSAHRPAAG